MKSGAAVVLWVPFSSSQSTSKQNAAILACTAAIVMLVSRNYDKDDDCDRLSGEMSQFVRLQSDIADIAEAVISVQSAFLTEHV